SRDGGDGHADPGQNQPRAHRSGKEQQLAAGHRVSPISGDQSMSRSISFRLILYRATPARLANATEVTEPVSGICQQPGWFGIWSGRWGARRLGRWKRSAIRSLEAFGGQVSGGAESFVAAGEPSGAT